MTTQAMFTEKAAEMSTLDAIEKGYTDKDDLIAYMQSDEFIKSVENYLGMFSAIFSNHTIGEKIMTMTRKHAKQILTQRMIDAAQSVRKATFILEGIEPIVTGYQKAILEKHQFTAADEYRGDMPEGTVILDPTRTYLLSDKDFMIYWDECNQERIKAALIVDNLGQCPLLVAKHMRSKARQELIAAMEPLTGVSLGQSLRLIGSQGDRFEQLIELCLGMVINLTKAEGEV